MAWKSGRFWFQTVIGRVWERRGHLQSRIWTILLQKSYPKVLERRGHLQSQIRTIYSTESWWFWSQKCSEGSGSGVDVYRAESAWFWPHIGLWQVQEQRGHCQIQMALALNSVLRGPGAAWTSTEPNPHDFGPKKFSERSWSNVGIYRAESRWFGPKKWPKRSWQVRHLQCRIRTILTSKCDLTCPRVLCPNTDSLSYHKISKQCGKAFILEKYIIVEDFSHFIRVFVLTESWV